MNFSSIRPYLAPAAILLVGALLPLMLTSGFHLRLAMLIWVYAILNMGFNLLYGFAGQISMGQPAFFALGAYAVALLQTKAALPVWLSIPGALGICAALAVVVGLPVLRLRTHYLAMATLSLLLILAGVATRWTTMTGGSSGIPIPPITWGDLPLGRTQVYYVVLVVAAVALIVHDFIARSHLGRALRATRDDETSAAALGIDVTRCKLRVFVLAAVFAGVAGICYGQISLRVDVTMMDFGVLVSMLTVAAVGGLGTRFGPILGTILVVLLPQILTNFGELETLVYGFVLLLFLIFLPRGLGGLLEGLPWARWFGGQRRPPAAAAAAALHADQLTAQRK
jgi:branched-chain amino acid transport system permease protein